MTNYSVIGFIIIPDDTSEKTYNECKAELDNKIELALQTQYEVTQ